MIKNLIIAAHPDDEIIGCGGTIAKLINEGQKIFILFMAEGVTARFEKNQIDSIKAKKEILIREKNAISANKVLGVKKQHIIFSKNICCRMDAVPIIDHSKLIEKYIQKFKPYRIFTHSPLDLNVDHRLTFQAVMTATRPKKSNIFLKELLCFEILSSSNYNLTDPFKPNTFINISKFLNKKNLALSKYKKEVSKDSGRNKKKITTLASYRGTQCGADFAEAFVQIKRYLK